MNEFEKIPFSVLDTKKKITQSFVKNARALMIVFLLFVVIVVMTTDIHSITVTDVTNLGLEFFLLLCVSYTMYVILVGSGGQSGMSTDVYINAERRAAELKDKILKNGYQDRLNEFCEYYAMEELKSARMHYLALGGISYEEYVEKYAKLGRSELRRLDHLTGLQKKCLIKANSVKPVKITPLMLLGDNRMLRSRNPLGLSPGARKNIAFSTKFFKMALVSVGMSMIALDVILEPSWTVFASVCLKLASVVINGFGGYEDGVNNIVVDTVRYMDNRSDLMTMAIKYAEAHPKRNSLDNSPEGVI